MNHIQTPERVTTGPIEGSRKIYSSTPSRPDIAVPFREIRLTDKNQTPLNLFDPSGPYTDDQVIIDLNAGLPRPRAK